MKREKRRAGRQRGRRALKKGIRRERSLKGNSSEREGEGKMKNETNKKSGMRDEDTMYMFCACGG